LRLERRADRLAADAQHAGRLAGDDGRRARHALEDRDLTKRVAGQELAADLATGDHLSAAAQQDVVGIVEGTLAVMRVMAERLRQASGT
jgi:hypothetical protein